MMENRRTGKLTGPRTMWLNLILGELDGFSYAIGGSTIEFILIGRSRTSVAIEDGHVTIGICVNLSVLGTDAAADAAGIARLLSEEIRETIAYCQAIPADPFGFSEIAAREFVTKSEWRAFDWLKRFSEAEIKVSANILSFTT